MKTFNSRFGGRARAAMGSAVLVGCAFTPSARAATVFYNGDPTGLTEQTGIFGSDVAFAFDDFQVPAGQSWSIPDFQANVSLPASQLTDNNGQPAAVEIEVRTGMSQGNAGTLVFATTLNPTYTPIAKPAGNTSPNGAYLLDARIPSNAPIDPPVFTAGTYWLGISPFLANTSEFSTAIFETSGANSIDGLPDNTSYFYDSSANLVARINADLSYTLDDGTVPEPATATLLAAAVFTVLPRTRRRR